MYDPEEYISRLGWDTRWIGVDLDGCLAEAIWPNKGIGEPIGENIAKLRALVDADYKIIIYTSRHWEEYEAIERWLNDHNIPYRDIICGKPMFRSVFDDKAFNSSEPDWLKAQDRIRG